MSRMTARRAAGAFLLLGGVVLGPVLAPAPARADKIRNPTAVFAGLDKITGRTVSFEVAVDETVQFGALQLTPRVCYTRPPTESAKTTAFLEVDEVTLENKYRRIFTGWMFASSPGLHAIEHPIYDVWLVDCKGGTDIVAEPKEQEDAPVAAAKPEGRKRREQARGEEAPRARQVNRQGQVDVEPLRGTPVQPRQSPSRKFFPTNGGPSPAGADPMDPNPR
ncbi:DUF2155 domain-containing protein [Methylobacterium platani]|uniref:Glycosyl hydrolase family 5 n=2 Tax=Methylobacterium platani TaxID=427683 RepID=A0A179SFR4_9HYPH|nr:DUF2155 domain-containing protein [Methylobacterium platani]KMO20164.1 hypothetical protein SQ03_06305 [Methylobacterium platani JCM 14648]OAS25715.1 hypothetical protein A5481_07680 [Methylobacterium platani]